MGTRSILPGQRGGERIRRWMPLLWALWALCLGVAVWLMATGYRYDVAAYFYPGFCLIPFLLILSKRGVSRVLVHNLINTWLLLTGLVLIWDLFEIPRKEESPEPPTTERAFSFEAAQGDPLVFRNWWTYYVREWGRLFELITEPGPPEGPRSRLIPNTEITFLNSQYSINSLGFRNREVSVDKGDQFRIVVLGESTTMGMTMEPEDRPWSEWLESFIRDEPGLMREVEIINAGVAAHTLGDSLARLQDEILPLNPDLIISYHGYNGFEQLTGTGLDLHEMPPFPIPRPSKILERLEHQWRLAAYNRRRLNQDEAFAHAALGDAGTLNSVCGQWNLRLVEATADAGIPLVLLSFNMAVNQESSEELIEFYRQSFLYVKFAIHANQIHTHLLKRLAKEHAGVEFLDTAPGLNGVHSHYIDLVHFTESGRELLAQNILSGLRPLLPITPED
jgi:lysophospholipase L1-like esterase